ncbi:uroporphyrinogen-III C-methyltransferase [Roseomonas sp. PWR1]|uniref:Uroporphyrinogen-III C-methyltransferase n=1 Tax=Roseomonas nitratireducens TaxID=2820810 RepID=A0ABS4AMZ0_9PROT|nr:siroheme synthase CysG [Neoroseomonas nitratireducens]MBP0462721.1 uroporphyrinogen-III C-methyltransferase [Neoroseomonas nitratireducens]
MRHFPAFLDLAGRTVLLVGDGEAIARKAEPLRRAGAVLRQAPRFAPALLDGVALAVGSDAPEEDLRALSAEAQRRGIPVNIVDRTELCSFITPAIIDRDPVTIAISTGGAAPTLARMVRQRIETVLPPRLGALAALAARFQALVRRALPDLPARRRFLDAALAGKPGDLALAGREAEAEAAFAAALGTADARPAGRVFLVGAGPGAADLLTLRALRLLGEADVIVHDRLVSDDVLDMARRDAERIFVGKARANHCLPQEEINALLVRLAREGKRVVRLKGGDPFVFGRGGEEAAALAEAGIAHEVVPGITAALACAADAGIPLTHRAAARALTLVTGHTRDGRLDLDFAALARPGQTLAVYMGAATLPDLVAGLVGAGRDPSTPAAMVEDGGTGASRRLEATLATLPAAARGWASGRPALILVGEVVGLAPGAAGEAAAAALPRARAAWPAMAAAPG